MSDLIASVMANDVDLGIDKLGEMSPFMDFFLRAVNVFANFIEVIVVLDIIAILMLLFLEKYDPRSFAAWIILLIFLPPVGFILYMYMGRTIYNRRKFMPSNITPAQMEEANRYQKSNLKSDLQQYPEHRHALSIAETLSNAGVWSYTKNNDICLYTEGSEKISSMFEDLRKAKKSILIEYYIVRNDRVGNEFMDILTSKVKEGVEVRFLTDGFGIGKGPKDGIRRFVRAGGHYAMFHSGITLMFSPKKNNRNHRKIAIIDGEVAYCGGFNIGDEYLGEGPLGHWRDASVRVVGDGVLPMVVRFSADWHYSKPRDRMGAISDYIGREVLDHHGNDRMQLVSGGPDTMPDNLVQMQYLAMISNAKERLYICTPYLVPDDSTSAALKNAAMSGVDVRILIPDKKDHIFLYWNNLTFSNDLMEAGVRIYMYNDGFIHEKMVLMDDCCCSVGSANLDNRSLALNFETNVMMYSRRLCDQAYRQFMDDLDCSTEYSCEAFDERTTIMKIRMAISRMFTLLA